LIFNDLCLFQFNEINIFGLNIPLPPSKGEFPIHRLFQKMKSFIFIIF
jgi:hypothetical protein